MSVQLILVVDGAICGEVVTSKIGLELEAMEMAGDDKFELAADSGNPPRWESDVVEGHGCFDVD